MTLPLVVTDLDGTLLDHDDYSYSAAEPSLRELKRRGIPVLMNSSKTCAEIVALQEQLGFRDPFICENGAAIYVIDRSGRPTLLRKLAGGRNLVLQALHEIRRETGYSFSGFADMPVAEIADLTGLSMEQAALAAEREYSEPLVWREDGECLSLFLRQLELRGLQAQQGGRFLTVAGSCDKARAMLLLRDWYAQRGPVMTVALGEGPNDQAMLEASDLAVVIRSRRQEPLNLARTDRTFFSRAYGPAGWQEVMADLLASGIFTVGEE